MTLSQIAKKHKVSLKELQKQVDMGMKAESEHTSSKREQMKIVKDHLFENPKYYTLLKRAGLKHGGRVNRQSLVRDSKRGNTPARDLNNYNDVLDIDADGVYGAETGLFDDGGAVKEVVDYVSFAKYSDIPFHEFDESNYVSFSEFKEVVKELYEDSGYTNKRTIALCINNMDSVSRFGIQVSKGRNTNSNFNPYTGTFEDLKKNLQKFSAGNFDMFDWDKWSGVKTSKTTPSQTSKQIDLKQKKIWIGYNPALSKKIQERAIELGFDWWGGNGTPTNLEFDNLFFDNNEKITSSSDRRNFDSFGSFEEITEADIFGTGTATPTFAPIELLGKKIWVQGNPDLSRRVQELGFANGFESFDGKVVIRTNFSSIYFVIKDGKKFMYILDSNSTEFDEASEIEVDEIDLFPTSNSSQTSVQNTPVENEDWVKKFTADLDKLVTYLPNDIDFAPELSKERKDLENLKKLLPSFQQSKYAVERAKILNEIKKLNYKLTYEGFIKPNEALSSDANLFTPQGLLDYYFTQATQNPTADLEPACELITPNGEKSKLPLSAYLNVRTPQFKNWFGDWEKAYETGNYVNCSKMIDPDTKEPKIYFHGVRKYVPNFGQFSNMGQGVTRPYGAFEPPSFPASYFAGEEDYAKFYGGVAENMPTPSIDYKPFIYKVFLSVKNPISLLPLDFMLSYKDFMDYIYVGYGVKVDPNQELLKQLNNDMTKKNPMWIYVRRDIGFIEKLKDYGYDALFQIGDIPTFLPNGEVEPDRTKHLQEVEYLTFYPSQVKSATVKKSFYFDFFNDIRFKNGGYVRI
jgi:hypothetical protein